MALPEQWLLIALLVVAVLLLVSSRVRPDLVAFLVLALLPLTGAVSFPEALSGFSRSVVITIIGLFILSQALEDTGVVAWIADRMRHAGGGSEARLVLLFMGVAAGLSLLMNNLAVAAVLLPAAVQVGRESRVAPSKLLLPLSFGTLLGGMATYFTTANILLSGLLTDRGERDLGMLDFLPTGGLIAVAGIAFMTLAGRHALPRRESAAREASPYLLSRSLYESYLLGEQLWEVRVPAGSVVAGSTLAESRLGERLGVTVLAVWRKQRAIFTPPPSQVLEAGDILLVLGSRERVTEMAAFGLEPGRDPTAAAGSRENLVDLTEVLIPPRSSAVGKTLIELDFRSRHSLTAVALWRQGTSYRTDVGSLRLEVGDALLMVGAPQHIRELERETDFLVLQSSHAARPRLPQKAWLALGIAAAVLAASVFELLPTSEAMMLGVVALAFTGCIHLDAAYRSIDWRLVFLVAGMLPLSLAMTNSGLAARIGESIVALLGPSGPLALVAGLCLIALVLTQLVGGQVAALLVGPVAVGAALELSIDVRATAVGVAIACSMAFLTPISHPTNVLVMGPGGYVPRDFWKVGLAMTLVCFAALLAGLAVFWGL